MKVIFRTPLRVEVIGDDLFRLTERFQVLIEDGDKRHAITVDADKHTDFSSVPRIPLGYLYVGGRAKKAGTVHDDLYERGGTEEDRLYADNVFLAIALHPDGDKLDTKRANAMYQAVRAFGGQHFNYAPGEKPVAAVLEPNAP